MRAGEGLAPGRGGFAFLLPSPDDEEEKEREREREREKKRGETAILAPVAPHPLFRSEGGSEPLAKLRNSSKLLEKLITTP